MKSSQMNACLVLFLVSVALHGSYGENALGEKCTSSSDCDYSHGRCVKYDKCETGTCGCDYGYTYVSYLCQKLKEIGDRCDVIEDACYAGSCKGVCTCGRDKHASDDKKQCIGQLYGEPCDKNTNYNWKRNICDYSKGLQCEGEKCVCPSGMKHVGDHCEYCSSDDKEYTVKVRVNGVETEVKKCVQKSATLKATESTSCSSDKVFCGDFLKCTTCTEWEDDKNAKCLAGGADSQRTNAAASLGLVLVAFFAMLR